jgi:hypothetical protein
VAYTYHSGGFIDGLVGYSHYCGVCGGLWWVGWGGGRIGTALFWVPVWAWLWGAFQSILWWGVGAGHILTGDGKAMRIS